MLEKYQKDHDIITKVIEDAVKEVNIKEIKGKETTPFLLAKIKDITKGQSLESNIHLVYNNVAVATDLAIELAKLG